MIIESFTDQYDDAAPLFDMTAEVLRQRDAAQGQVVQRWLAIGDEGPVGAVNTWLRPDDRLFLSFRCRLTEAYAPLAEAVVEALMRPVHTTVAAEDAAVLASLREAGFATELEAEEFRVPFARALAAVDRAWVPSGFSLHPANRVDEDRLFVLDNALRQDTPGTDGWHGDRVWFHEELAESPPFDPTAYLVAVHEATGDYAGLVRIWRNPSGPRVGLIGVARPYRRTPIAAALLKQALNAASQWGHETFTTETSLTNRAIHPRLQRMGSESLGRFFQLVRSP